MFLRFFLYKLHPRTNRDYYFMKRRDFLKTGAIGITAPSVIIGDSNIAIEKEPKEKIKTIYKSLLMDKNFLINIINYN